MCKSLLFLESLSAVHADAPPIPADLHALAERMASLDYNNLAILGAVSDARRYGSLWESENVDDEDLEQLEELLPGVNAWQWPAAADAYLWTTDGHAIAGE